MANRWLWSVRRSARWFHPDDIARNVQVQWRLRPPTRRDIPAFTRLRNAARSVIDDLPTTGPIWAVSMVRDEEDIIEETIANLVDQGVDRVLVADNGSTDRTPEILDCLHRTLPLDWVRDPIPQFWQADKVTRLARAATRFGAGWIIPFDADELWHGDRGTIRDVLHSATTPVVDAEWYDYAPIDCGGDRFATRFPFRLASPAPQRKVAFRANWLARVQMGNHGVAVPDPTSSRGLRIAHYRFRSTEQMTRKAANGSAAIRAAGSRTRAEAWFTITRDGRTAAQVRQELVDRDDLVFDPSDRW